MRRLWGALFALLLAMGSVAPTPTTRAAEPVPGYFTARYNLAAVATADGRIFTLGGRTVGDDAVSGVTERYRLLEQDWATLPSMPNPRYGFGAAATLYNRDLRVFAIGGTDGTKLLDVVDEYNANTNEWTPARSLLRTPRYDLGVVTTSDGRIFAVGGDTAPPGAASAAVVATLEEYKVADNAWYYWAPMGTPRAAMAVAWQNVGGEKLYAIGGRNDAGQPLSVVEEYDLQTNTWTTKAPMPTPRYGATAVGADNGKIYVMGGIDAAGNALSVVEEFDPATNSWQTKMSMPTGRGRLAAVRASSGKLYAIGGETNPPPPNPIEIYDVATGNWGTATQPTPTLTSTPIPSATPTATASPTPTATATPMASAIPVTSSPTPDMPGATPPAQVLQPSARTWLGAALGGNGRIYAVGGDSGGSILSTVEEYEPATRSWARTAQLPTARRLLGVASLNGKIYAVGGRDTYNVARDTVEEYDPATGIWSARAHLLTARSGLALAAVGGKLYAFGGHDVNGMALNTVEEYDPVANTWTAKASMPAARAYMAAAPANGKIYLAGGQDAGGATLSSVEEFDPAANAWAAKAAMPTARFWLGLVAASNGRLYALGGDNGVGAIATVEEYDPVANSWQGRAPMPNTLFGFGASAANNGRIYTIGGATRSTAYSLLQEYDPGSNTWTGTPVVPTPTPNGSVTPTATTTPTATPVPYVGRPIKPSGNAWPVSAVAGEVVTLVDTPGSLMYLDIYFRTDASGTVTIQDAGGTAPSGVNPPNRVVIDYFLVDHPGIPDSAIKEVNLHFRAPATARGVELSRHQADGSWEHLPTRAGFSNAIESVYETRISTLSTFAITVGQGTALLEDLTELPNTGEPPPLVHPGSRGLPTVLNLLARVFDALGL